MNGGYSNFSPYGMQSFQPYGRPDFGGQMQQMGYQPMGGMEAPSKLLAPGAPPGFQPQVPPAPDLPPGMGIGRPMIVNPQPYNPYGQGPSNPGGPQNPTSPTTPASPVSPSDQASNDDFRHYNAYQSFLNNGMPLPSWYDGNRANAHLSNWANNPNNPANFIKQGR